MTREEWKERLPLVQAFANGEKLQCLENRKWNDLVNPDFSYPIDRYRIAPEQKWRKWTLDEVPIGAQVRYRGDDKSVRLLIVGTFQFDKVILGSSCETNTKSLLDQREHSTDGGKTWHPCGVLESQ